MASMVLPYRHDMGGHCGSGALRDLTEWAGIRWAGDTPNEGIVFALGGPSTSRMFARGTYTHRSTWLDAARTSKTNT